MQHVGANEPKSKDVVEWLLEESEFWRREGDTALPPLKDDRYQRAERMREAADEIRRLRRGQRSSDDA
jgi:hypothetical protein